MLTEIPEPILDVEDVSTISESQGKRYTANQENNNGNSSMQNHSGFDMIKWIQIHLLTDLIFYKIIKKYNKTFQLRGNLGFFFWVLLVFAISLEFIYRIIMAFAIILIIVAIILVFLKGVGIIDWDPKYIGCKLQINNCP